MLGSLHHLNDPQCILGILRYCLGTPKLVYSLRTNTPSNGMLKVLKSFNDGQRNRLDQILGTIIGDDAWKQSFLPNNLSGQGIRQSQKPYKGAFVGSMIASDVLVNKNSYTKVWNRSIFFYTRKRRSKKHLIKKYLLP